MKESMFVKRFKALGTEIDVQICANESDAEKVKKTIDVIVDKYRKFEKIFSRFDIESELTQLNNNLEKIFEVSSDMLDVAKKSLRYNVESEGFFDPRIIKCLENSGYDKSFHDKRFFENKRCFDSETNPRKFNESISFFGDSVAFNERMDFSGVAKGYITDKISNYIMENGWRNFIVDSGGDMYVGGCENGVPWRIRLEGVSEEKILFTLSDCAVATSGISRRKWEIDGKRFHHIVNPKKPNEFNFDIKSVTVISPSAEKSDVWAKVLFLMGKKQGSEFAMKNKIASVFLMYSGDVWISPETKKFLA